MGSGRRYRRTGLQQLRQPRVYAGHAASRGEGSGMPWPKGAARMEHMQVLLAAQEGQQASDTYDHAAAAAITAIDEADSPEAA